MPAAATTIRQACEQNGAAGRVDSFDGGIPIGRPGLHPAAVPAHDEQSVVDSHTQADQHGQVGGGAGDAQGMAEQAHHGETDAQGQARGGQRQQGRKYGATEDDQQDDQRGDHTDRDGQARLRSLRVGDGRTAEGDMRIRAVGGFGRGDEIGGVGGRHVSGLRGPGDTGERDGAVAADLFGAGRRIGTGHRLDAGHRGDLRQRCGDRVAYLG